MRQRLSMLAVLLVLAFTSLSAADVDGKWTAQMAGRDGQTREQTFTFKADGEKLTGTISGMMGGADTEIKDGTVKGDDIAFAVVRSFQGQEMKILYKGKVSGAEIKFTSQREGGEPREFTAKRVTS
jgi:opacity protein-like surface antigen